MSSKYTVEEEFMINNWVKELEFSEYVEKARGIFANIPTQYQSEVYKRWTGRELYHE